MIDEKKLIQDIKKYHSELKPRYISKLVDEEIEDIIDIINEQPKFENTVSFKHFKLHADSTLKSMKKDDLIHYIHVLYSNWNATDWYYNNVMKYAEKLNKELEIDKYNSPQWISCSESLPELYKNVLVTVETQGGYACFVSSRFDFNGVIRWSSLCGQEPVAWMPLPEPYQEEKDE